MDSPGNDIDLLGGSQSAIIRFTVFSRFFSHKLVEFFGSLFDFRYGY